jgi:tRNA A37 methylthiotransferase MiaB
VGFPGETRGDVETLARFLSEADLDAVGVFGYSDEEGTQAASMAGKVSAATVERRRARITDLAEALTAARAERRVGTTVEVLVEDVVAGVAHGCAGHQQPEVDGGCAVRLPTGGVTAGVAEGPRDAVGGGRGAPAVRVGDLVRARVVGSEGVDLVAEFVEVLDAAAGPPSGRP